MRNVWLKFFGFLFVVYLVTLPFSSKVQAATVYGQHDNSVLVGTGTPTEVLGTGLSGIVSSFTGFANVTAFTGGHTFDAYAATVGECPTSSYTGCTLYFSGANGNPAGNLISNTGFQYITFVFNGVGGASNTIFLNPSKYYYIQFASNLGFSTFEDWGSPTTQVSAPCRAGAFPSCAGSGGDYFWDLGDTVTSGFSTGSDTTRITLMSPAPHTNTASTTVTFSGQFYVNSSITFSAGSYRGCDVFVQAVDGLGDFAPGFYPGSCSATTTDLLTAWTATVELPIDRDMQANAELLFGTGTASSTWVALYNSGFVPFSVVSGAATDTTIYSDCGLTALSGCLQNAALYLFAPSNDSISQFKSLTLANSVPFSYLYDFPNLVNDLQHPATTTSLVIDIPTLGVVSSSTIRIFSPAMVTSLSFWPLIYNIFSWLLYLGTAYSLWLIIHQLHDDSHK